MLIKKKRAFIYLLQNSQMDVKKLIPRLKMPFDAILEASKTKDWLANPKGIINKALGTILTAFEDVNQMEVIKVRWEQIKKLQP